MLGKLAAGRRSAMWIAVGAFLLLGLSLPLSAAEFGSEEFAFACNSDVSVQDTGPTMDPTVFNVMLRVENVDSNDAGNMASTQTFAAITYNPSCTSTIPCVPGEPPGEPAGTLLNFVPGSATSNCMGVGVGMPSLDMAAVAGDGTVTFSFTPTLELGPNADPDTGPPTACEVFFQVQAANPAEAATFLMEVNTSGICTFRPGFSSDTTGTDDVTFAPVPTMGQFALFVLALLLTTSAWVALRRKPATQP